MINATDRKVFTKTPRGQLIIDPDDKCSLTSRLRLMNFHCKTPLCWPTAKVKKKKEKRRKNRKEKIKR